MATFGSLSEDNCQNCATQKKNHVLSRAQVPLTIPILDVALDKNDKSIPSNNLELGVMSEEENGDGVFAFLKNSLSYKVVNVSEPCAA